MSRPASPAHFMLYSEYGIPNYGNTMLTQPERAEKEPELCAAFVDGMMEGLKATLLDPTEAMKVFFQGSARIGAGRSRPKSRSASAPAS
jgi:NitT/TauT family transport system substrate-binding protein